ncbi:MAG: hypothetical protein WBF87_17755, partial [Mesorhizobium sp.]
LHGLPVLARDIEVFREVAPPGSRFFADAGPDALAQAIAEWVDAPAPRHKRPDILGWAQSADNLFRLIADPAVATSPVSSRHAGMLDR